MKVFAGDKLNVGEKIVRKGEIAGYQHFLLFPQCFQKASGLDWSKLKVYAGDKLNVGEKIVRKGEIAGY